MPSFMQEHASEATTRLRRALAPVRGLWIGFESDLTAIGISSLDDLRRRSADDLLERYCRHAGRPPDIVLRAYFEAVVTFAQTGQAPPVWRIMRRDAIRDQDGVRHAVEG